MHLHAVLLHIVFGGIFLGGSYVGSYDRPSSFGGIQATAAYAGFSVQLTPRSGIGVLPVIVGTDGHRAVVGAGISYRFYLWLPSHRIVPGDGP